MKLHEYLDLPGALSVSQLRERVGVKSDIQIRQWRHGYADRQPAPEFATALEIATGGLVRRWDSRPKDWHRIWPELIGADGAPPAPAPDSVPPTERTSTDRAAASLTQSEVDHAICGAARPAYAPRTGSDRRSDSPSNRRERAGR